ncbi:hypothetical protein AOQ84DRAFT_363920, partial [Glonium stellatum]
SPTASAHEAVITLSIRRHAHALSPRVARLTIPSSLTTRGPATAELHFATLDFDDAFLATSLRTHYARLAGPWRFVSARKLVRITVCAAPAWSGGRSECCAASRGIALGAVGGDGAAAAAAAKAGVHVRCPRLLASRGLADTFSEEKLMRLYARPKEGKARYAWVHWVRRVAAANGTLEVRVGREKGERDGDEEEGGGASAGTAMDEADGEARVGLGFGSDDFVTGLEFVEGWSVGRILVALGVVLMLSLLATFLWVFFGTDWVHIGFRGASERVATGSLLGLLVLFLGLTGVGGWLWASWLVL